MASPAGSKQTAGRHPSPISLCHHRSSAESSGNRLKYFPRCHCTVTCHTATYTSIWSRRSILLRDSRMRIRVCSFVSAPLMALLNISAKKAGVFLRHSTTGSIPCPRSPDISWQMLFSLLHLFDISWYLLKSSRSVCDGALVSRWEWGHAGGDRSRLGTLGSLTLGLLGMGFLQREGTFHMEEWAVGWWWGAQNPQGRPEGPRVQVWQVGSSEQPRPAGILSEQVVLVELPWIVNQSYPARCQARSEGCSPTDTGTPPGAAGE